MSEIDAIHARHEFTRRGIAITPVKFGISFTATFFNQAGALVLVYRDGSVQVNHGGTEMGQGLHTRIRQIAADGLGVPAEAIRIMPTRTDKIPNTSATAASTGTDLNGAAVFDACRQIRERLAPIAVEMPDAGFPALVEAAYKRRIPLFAHGFYRTPEIHFDPKTASGKPFHYFAFAAAVSEVEVDGFTGDSRVLRVDILEDVGDSLSPLIDRGQIEGGFVQGLGWLTIEELIWDARGRLATRRLHLQAAIVVGTAARVQRLISEARNGTRRHYGKQSGGRAAADAGFFSARGDSRGHRRLWTGKGCNSR